MRYYVTSDIHGFYTPFIEALTRSGYFMDTTPHKLVILGDLFDRGKEAIQLQAFILDLMERDEVILIRGNHEDLFEELVTEDEGLAYSHHVSNGTYETALRLTGYDMAIAMVREYDFVDAAKETAFYRKIIPAMRDCYETEHYVFVHGWIPCIRERDGSYSYNAAWRTAGPAEWRKARWYNGMDAARTAADETKTVVCGHWHTSYGHSKYEQNGPEFGEGADFRPYRARGILALDACTAYSGMVNCVVLED